MNNTDRLQLSSLLLQKSKEFGADVAGITSVKKVLETPSHQLIETDQQGTEGNRKAKKLNWRKDGSGVLVHGISHPEDRPELDWWYGDKSPPGNQKLIEINKHLSNWINDNYSELNVYKIPYSIDKGGIFLKDAAVMAGLGCIGYSNLFISPEYGPRIRLRALIINQELVETGPIDFDPCSNCSGYCRQQCPQEAFYDREGYQRHLCNVEMKKSEKAYSELSDEELKLLKYCRACEFACPVGNI